MNLFMQTLTDIKSFLAAHGLRPKYRFGQNFLHDANKIRQIVEAAAISPGERVLEVGAGTGALSQALLEAGANLVAVEVDRDLEPILRRELEPFAGRVTLVMADVLASKNRINPEVLAPLGDDPFKLVANLPYNVASPLIANMAVDHLNMMLAVVMVQREVGQRLVAQPGGRDYGPLGIVVQAMCRVETVTTLPPACFWPRPKVDSVVLKITRRDQPLTRQPEKLATLVQKLFQKRRKQIGTILGRSQSLPADIAPHQRPQELAVEQLVALSSWLS
jgi:16S rRNA (adenine1518-N6/adenine1519-N6)-dimethyltransferase